MKKLAIRFTAVLLVVVMLFAAVACASDNNDEQSNQVPNTPSNNQSSNNNIQIGKEEVVYTEATRNSFRTIVKTLSGVPDSLDQEQEANINATLDEMLDVLSVSRISEPSLTALIALAETNKPLLDRFFLSYRSEQDVTAADLDAVKQLYTSVLNIIGDTALGQVLHGITLKCAEMMKEDLLPEFAEELEYKRTQFGNYLAGNADYFRRAEWEVIRGETSAEIVVFAVNYYGYMQNYDYYTCYYTYFPLNDPDLSKLPVELKDILGYYTDLRKTFPLSSVDTYEKQELLVDQLLFERGVDRFAESQCMELYSNIQTVASKLDSYVKNASTADFVTMTKLALTLASVAQNRADSNTVVEQLTGDGALTQAEMTQLIMDNKAVLRDLSNSMNALTSCCTAMENILGVMDLVGADLAGRNGVYQKLVRWVLLTEDAMFDTMAQETAGALSSLFTFAAGVSDSITRTHIEHFFDTLNISMSWSANNPTVVNYMFKGQPVTGAKVYEVTRTCMKDMVSLYRTNAASLGMTADEVADVILSLSKLLAKTGAAVGIDERIAAEMDILDEEAFSTLLSMILSVADDVTDAQMDTLLEVMCYTAYGESHRVPYYYNGEIVYYYNTYIFPVHCFDHLGNYISTDAYYAKQLEAVKTAIRFAVAQSGELDGVDIAKVLNQILKVRNLSAAVGDHYRSTDASDLANSMHLEWITETLLSTPVLTALGSCKNITDAEIDSLLAGLRVYYKYNFTTEQYEYRDCVTGKVLTNEARSRLFREAEITMFKIIGRNSGDLNAYANFLEKTLPEIEKWYIEMYQFHQDGEMPPKSNQMQTATVNDVITALNACKNATPETCWELERVFTNTLRDYFYTMAPCFMYAN